MDLAIVEETDGSISAGEQIIGKYNYLLNIPFQNVRLERRKNLLTSSESCKSTLNPWGELRRDLMIEKENGRQYKEEPREEESSSPH